MHQWKTASLENMFNKKVTSTTECKCITDNNTRQWSTITSKNTMLFNPTKFKMQHSLQQMAGFARCPPLLNHDPSNHLSFLHSLILPDSNTDKGWYLHQNLNVTFLLFKPPYRVSLTYCITNSVLHPEHLGGRNCMETYMWCPQIYQCTVIQQCHRKALNCCLQLFLLSSQLLCLLVETSNGAP